MSEWDIVVIGGGGAGLVAAITAAEQGARVVLFESEEELGGSTQLSAGVFNAAGTRVQATLKVEDSVDALYHHYMDLNQWRLQPGLIRTFCEQATPTLEWLISLGVEVPATLSGDAHTPGLYKAGVESIPRGHVPVDQGLGIVQALDRERRRLGVEAILGTRVERLLFEDGRVTGVVADGLEVEVDAVVVASGGFAHNRDLVAELYPQALKAGDDLFVVAAPGSRGDAIELGREVGADLAGQGWGLLLVTAYFQRYHHWQSGFPPKSRVYVDSSGRRFIDEDASYAIAAGIFEDHGGWGWAIFDETARNGLAAGYADWTPTRIEEEVREGRSHRADSLEELARIIDVPAENLLTTVQRWNQQLPDGEDPDFLRHVTLVDHAVDPHCDPIATPPFYAVRVLPDQLVCTHAGLRIDASARVLDTTGRAIPGLYAAGEASGGILGERYVGGGNSIASALTFGRIAGRTAAHKVAARTSR